MSLVECQASNNSLSDYQDKPINLGDDEHDAINRLRDMPQDSRRRLLKAIELVWQEGKGLL